MSLDAVIELNEEAGCGLELVALIEEGQSGAALVRWPDGRDAVVTTALTSLAHMQQTAAILRDVKSLGIPVPDHQFLFPRRDGTVAVVQERLPGCSVPTVDSAVIDAIIALNDRFALMRSPATNSFTSISPCPTRCSYWAHHTITMLHWNIRNNNHEAIDTYLRLGESKLN